MSDKIYIKNMTHEEAEKTLRKLYLEDKMSITEVSGVTDISRAMILTKLRRYNLPTRTIKEGVRLSLSRRKEKNALEIQKDKLPEMLQLKQQQNHHKQD